jgi:hypothetical protein
MMTDANFPTLPERQPPLSLGQVPGRVPIMPHLEVFLSHSNTDKPHVELVARQIEALGIKVYLAEDNPEPGTILVDKVRAAIHRSKAFVVLVTTTSINSAYVMQEIGIAKDRGVPIIPIIEKGIDVRALGVLQGLDYLEYDPTEPAEAMAKIVQSLQPYVLRQIPTGADAGTTIMLVGVGLLLGFLLYAALSEGGAAPS